MNTATDAKGSKSVLVKTTGHEKLRITTMLSLLASGMKLTSFAAILKRTNVLKESGITFNVMRKGG
jgi:hypothetical protein